MKLIEIQMNSSYNVDVKDKSFRLRNAKQIMDVIKHSKDSANETVDVINQNRPGTIGISSASYKAENIEKLY